MAQQHLIVDGRLLAFETGDSVATAVLRAGEHPRHGGCLCLSGDCGNCCAVIDGIAYVRSCQTPARPGLVVRRHPAIGAPSLWSAATGEVAIRHATADVVVVGSGESGRRAAAGLGDRATVLDAASGSEVVGVYAGPTVVARTAEGMVHLHAHEVIIATGAAELHPVCEGANLAGIVTAAAARQLHAAGVDLGDAVAVGAPPEGVPCTAAPGELVRFEGSGRVNGVVLRDADGVEHRHACHTAIVGLGRAARDTLSRMAGDLPVRAVGPAAESFPVPPCPTSGVVCPCSGVTVDDLEGVWARGFNEMELVKRASLAGTGPCQGGVCVPHVRAFIARKTGEIPEPFTARPASRQITLAEAAAGVFVDAFRRTPLHEEHLRLGATMDRFGGWWRPWNYGDHVAEYWAVREAVSLGDVSTLGKLVVSGPDAVELLERVYPTTVADIRPGRSRYVLLLNERGHVFDDGMICRETESRFVLTFTSGGAANAEAWLRDWIETWGLDVRVLDRTMSLAAINVTGPLAGALLQRVGVSDPPKFLQHRHEPVAGVPCQVMRLSFTGEASFELHHAVDRSAELWRALLAAGRDLGVRPHGLQALFGLRLEKGHVIVGTDTELDSTPRRIGMDWAVKMGKPDFIGRTALERTARLPDHRRLVSLVIPGTEPAPIEGSPIMRQGEILGHVSSTFASPLLGRTVMLGWLKRGWSPDDERPNGIEVGGRAAMFADAPFYDPEGARARL